MQIPAPASEEARALARALSLSVTAADVLRRRGFGDDATTRKFLEPRLSHLTVPDAMADRAKASERLAKAVRDRERIAIFGDYDCDGITAAAVLTEALRTLGGDVVPLLATRFDGGYGLSDRAVERVLSVGPRVLVTCDCGSADAPRLARVRGAGIDAVVIDHHLVPDEPLDAVAFLNPHRPECGFPYKGLASCGLALSVAAGVRALLGVELDLRPLLDLVAIGTIADVAPLDGDNRPLVRAGLAAIAQSRRPGIRALAENAKLELAVGVAAEDVAFRLAPRINAPGRLGAPDVSLELLLERDPVRARQLAAEVEHAQQRRREVEREVLDAAFRQIEERGLSHAPAVVVAGEGWSHGVVGIVAGRIASRLGKPTIVVGLEGETGRGSVRGPRGFRLHDALRSSADAMLSFGGHQAAAGVVVAASQIEKLRERFAEACASAGGASVEDEVTADAVLDAADAPARVVEDLARFEPCGEGNPAPRVAIAGAKLCDAREVKGGHLKLTIETGGRRMSAFGAEMGARAASLAGRVDLVGRLRRDGWKGGDAVEVKIEAVETAG
jgi:single-stranded-DNA-specific exonuclease